LHRPLARLVKSTNALLALYEYEWNAKSILMFL